MHFYHSSLQLSVDGFDLLYVSAEQGRPVEPIVGEYNILVDEIGDFSSLFTPHVIIENEVGYARVQSPGSHIQPFVLIADGCELVNQFLYEVLVIYLVHDDRGLFGSLLRHFYNFVDAGLARASAVVAFAGRTRVGADALYRNLGASWFRTQEVSFLVAGALVLHFLHALFAMLL